MISTFLFATSDWSRIANEVIPLLEPEGYNDERDFELALSAAYRNLYPDAKKPVTNILRFAIREKREVLKEKIYNMKKKLELLRSSRERMSPWDLEGFQEIEQLKDYEFGLRIDEKINRILLRVFPSKELVPHGIPDPRTRVSFERAEGRSSLKLIGSSAAKLILDTMPVFKDVMFGHRQKKWPEEFEQKLDDEIKVLLLIAIVFVVYEEENLEKNLEKLVTRILKLVIRHQEDDREKPLSQVVARYESSVNINKGELILIKAAQTFVKNIFQSVPYVHKDEIHLDPLQISSFLRDFIEFSYQRLFELA